MNALSPLSAERGDVSATGRMDAPLSVSFLTEQHGLLVNFGKHDELKAGVSGCISNVKQAVPENNVRALFDKENGVQLSSRHVSAPPAQQTAATALGAANRALCAQGACSSKLNLEFLGLRLMGCDLLPFFALRRH